MNKEGHSRTLLRGWKHFQEENEGRLPFLTGGSCRATIMGGEGSDERLLMRERNTSQLPRLLCCTMERGRATPPASGGGGEERLCAISGPSPVRLAEGERGWGPPREADQQHLEWGEQQMGDRGAISAWGDHREGRE